MTRLDDRDIKILSILQREGRITKSALAARVNLSPTPCWERLKRLEMAGIIEGYGAHVSWAVVGVRTIVFVQAELSSHQARDFELFERAIRPVNEVLECWAVGGGFDYLLKIAAANIDQYQRLIDELLKANIGLKRYYTYVVTKRIKENHMIPDSLLQATLE